MRIVSFAESSMSRCMPTVSPSRTEAISTFCPEALSRSFCSVTAVPDGSNFSVGMNFFFKAVAAIAPILKSNYRGNIVERHHVHKKDKPSGTAVTLRKLLESASGQNVEIASVREGDTVGMHLLLLDSANDTILMTHDANARSAFAD